MSKSVKKKLLFTVGALVSLFFSWSLSQDNFLMPIWTLQHALHCNAGEEEVTCHVLKYVTGDKPQRLASVYSLQSHVKLVLRLLSYCYANLSVQVTLRDWWIQGTDWLANDLEMAYTITPSRTAYLNQHVGVDCLFIWLPFSHVFVS